MIAHKFQPGDPVTGRATADRRGIVEGISADGLHILVRYGSGSKRRQKFTNLRREVPDDGLLNEYGLARPHFKLLWLVSLGPVSWPDCMLRAISGQPAAGLRKLIRMGLLDGPAGKQPIRSKPFSLTGRGRETLGRIERGLHKPAWITEARATALGQLVHRPKDSVSLICVRQITLYSLERNGYIRFTHKFQWSMTDLGREAWQEYLAKDGAGCTAS